MHGFLYETQVHEHFFCVKVVSCQMCPAVILCERAAKLWANGTNFRAFSIRLIKPPLRPNSQVSHEERPNEETRNCYCPKKGISQPNIASSRKKEGSSFPPFTPPQFQRRTPMPKAYMFNGPIERGPKVIFYCFFIMKIRNSFVKLT